ncbi:TIGR00730 family Rossman fold protein [Parasphingorhabdus halotolerans]|uniref:Cytokinin riboside 5'-monophosphate phosphoribohydrolase n=1 Tax=Parasphingorhabdus halotolerans TaxID=2725558 RepID=A0A6H2DKS1_9SPHN|nr:TIGR00730 family Rossman fold protein [Parasphingorhabdus halotolerans]QJB68737.1 TIGR00730 family Rossman fold protein [Parasphingorhabdus halotolerans]
MQNLAVYCGSATGTNPVFADTARKLGATMAERNINLVYGGGKLGLMGIIADAVLDGGGQVYGVIPDMLKDHEVAHTGVTELFIVRNMHERKAKMTELCDAFVALPGGIGTLDELFEAWTWNALGYHAKPFGLLNVANYWDSMVTFLDSVETNGFMSTARRKQLIVEDNIDGALESLKAACTDNEGKVTW